MLTAEGGKEAGEEEEEGRKEETARKEAVSKSERTEGNTPLKSRRSGADALLLVRLSEAEGRVSASVVPDRPPLHGVGVVSLRARWAQICFAFQYASEMFFKLVTVYRIVVFICYTVVHIPCLVYVSHDLFTKFCDFFGYCKQYHYHHGLISWHALCTVLVKCC